MITKHDTRGFTIVETILASVILCASVLALGAISTRSLSDTKFNRQYKVAAGLVERQLTMIDYIGIDDFLELGQNEGDFENTELTYHWEVTTASIDIDNLYDVKVVVSWNERNRPFEISVSSRLNGTSRFVRTTEQ